MIGRRQRAAGLAVLFCLLLAAGPGKAASPDGAEESLRRGLRFLMSQQGKDGGWHSETYGSMREGAANTSLILYAASHAPEEMTSRYRSQFRRATNFLLVGIRRRGYVCNPDGTTDFPSYGSAMTFTAARRLQLDFDAATLDQLIAFLVTAQIGTTREFASDNPHYGGWDLMGAQHVVGQTSGTNVSLGRFVMEALAASDLPSAKDALKQAKHWTERCQNFPSGDGGFPFTPDAKFQSNKAGRIKENDDFGPDAPIRSYGTTTCDGICCLLACGATSMDERVVAAVRWVAEHPQVKQVPGFEHFPESTGWEEGLRYYYYAGLVKILPLLPRDTATSIKQSLAERLVADQKKDGSWVNESARMREDDPLICSSLAVIALAELVHHE